MVVMVYGLCEFIDVFLLLFYVCVMVVGWLFGVGYCELCEVDCWLDKLGWYFIVWVGLLVVWNVEQSGYMQVLFWIVGVYIDSFNLWVKQYLDRFVVGWYVVVL